MFNEPTHNLGDAGAEQHAKTDAPGHKTSGETVNSIKPADLFRTKGSPVLDYEEIIIDLDQVQDLNEQDFAERELLMNKYLETMRVFRSGELVNGKIVAINDSEVAVDIGFKSEGSIPIEEFDHIEEFEVGDEIEVLIDSIENVEGTLVLSKKKAEFNRVWENINRLYQTGEMVEAEISRRIKGGMVVDLYGIEAFLPGSQIDVHPIRDFDALVGARMDFRIIKVNNIRKNVVLSHKVLVEESLREIRIKVLAELEEGQVVEGVVKNITDFGVFVDLGGVDGLLHITDLSWGRVSHPGDVVKLDERIKVKVLHYDKEKQRISLGLKQLKEHHWNDVDQRYPVGSKAKGKVVSLVKYGAFVELEEGIEGLVHISEMSWTQHIKHPSQLVNVADMIDVIILNVDAENRKISMGMKQCEEDPWERLEHVFLPGSIHRGVVRDLVPFGAFVELESGIDGLIHISDLSWTRKVRHPGEIVKKGLETDVVILNFDRNERRIALGLKQLEADPWDRFEKEYPIRAQTEGSVVRVLEKGIVVMLPLGVEGFIPNSQLGKSISGDNKRNIKEGDNLELEVIEFDKSNHRIVLSHAFVEKTKERANHRAYQESAEEPKNTIRELVGESRLTLEGELLVKETAEITAEKPAPVRRNSHKQAEPTEAAVIPEPVLEPELTVSEPADQAVPVVQAEPIVGEPSITLAESPADSLSEDSVEAKPDVRKKARSTKPKKSKETEEQPPTPTSEAVVTSESPD